MKKRMTRKLAFAAAVCSAFAMTSCGGGGLDDKQNTLPVEELPSVLAQEPSDGLEIASSVILSNEVSEEAETNPNSVLMKKDINVYYDNTTGCFMEYVNINKENPDDLAYQMFSKTMKSFKDSFDTASSYSTLTLQKDADGVLVWKDFADDVFLNFGNLGTYTYNVGGRFLDDTSPINMWTDELEEKHADSDAVSVYISDLNEQNGLLAKSGKDLKALLDAHEDKDLLIISYVLPFKGVISSPTSGNEGDGKSQTEDKQFDDFVDRNYYALAFGDRETLSALANVLRSSFGEIGLDMDTFMYRTSVYTETAVETKTLNGTDVGEDFLSAMPPEFSILDKDGNSVGGGEQQAEAPAAEEPETEADKKESAEDDLLGGKKKKDDGGLKSEKGSASILPNLALCSDYSDYLAVNPKGRNFMFKSLVPDMGGKEASLTLRLDNSDIYKLDTANASIYAFNNNDPASMTKSESDAVWLDNADLSKFGVKVSFEENTVRADMSTYLSDNEMIVISVPVRLAYTQDLAVRDLIEIPQEYEELAERCKVPDIITESNENEKFTKTYGFDTFMDKLTGYKAIVSSGKNPLTVNESHDTKDFDEAVDRLNIFIVSENTGK